MQFPVYCQLDKENKIMNKCKFCQIINSNKNDEEVVFETENFIVLTDKYRRTSVGAICLIIPKMHYKNLLEIPKENGNELLEVIVIISKSMQNAYKCNGIRLWTAVNREAGQSIFHSHIHILPCKSIKDRFIALFPGIYDLPRKILTFSNNRLNKKKNFELAEKIRQEIDKINV